MKNVIVWVLALVVGAVLGCLEVGWMNNLFDFIAAVYTRLFQFVAVPTIALAVITTLAVLGTKKNAGRIFAHTISYTLLTTFAGMSLTASISLCSVFRTLGRLSFASISAE